MLTLCTRLAAFGLFAFAGAANAASSLIAAPISSAVPAAPAAVERQMPQLECVVGFSKDFCGSLIPVTHPVTTGCISPVPSCRTLRFIGDFNVSMTNNIELCGPSLTATCNESEHGSFRFSPSFLIRLHDPCPYRGCWDGTATFTFRSGPSYKGQFLGTLGVGSHRPVSSPTTCNVNCGRTCERCYDVSYDPDSGQWRIGFEGAFHGDRNDLNTGEELCFTVSGDFLIPGTDAGPNWSSVWRVCGTADGTQLTFCP